MKTERLDSLIQNAVAFDLETHLIRPGLLAPPLVCGSAAENSPDGLKGMLLDKQGASTVFQLIAGNEDAVICGANIAYDFLVIAVHAAKAGIDWMPQIFNMYDPGRSIVRGQADGRVFDVQLAEALHAIAQGYLFKDARTGKDLQNPDTGRKARYSLHHCVDQVLGRDDAKVNDVWRLRYAELENIPMSEWPFQARQYPIDDAINTLEVALAQAGHLPSCNGHEFVESGLEDGLYCRHCDASVANAGEDCMRRKRRRNLHDLSRQTYAAWSLHLGASWGFSIDQDAVDRLEAKVDAKREADLPRFVATGIIRPDGTENQSVLKKLVATAYGAKDTCPNCAGTGKIPSEKTGGKTKVNCDQCNGSALFLPLEVPRTEKNQIACGRDPLLESGDELLTAYAEFSEKKIKTTYIPLLRTGRVCIGCGAHGTKKSPHADLCTQPGWRNVAANLRVNPLVETGRTSIEGGFHGLPRKGGVRECVVARPGYVFSSEDYNAGELVTLAQTCLRTVGYSKLAEALNAGLDAHLALAGTMTGKSYEAMLPLKKAGDKRTINDRQAAKAGNFGFGGGMAELTFALRKRADPDIFTPCENGPEVQNGVRGYAGLRTCILMDGHESCGVVKITQYKDSLHAPVCKACVESAKRLREFWFRQWPEMRDYFAYVQRTLDANNNETVQHTTKRIRGGVGFCDGANDGFQAPLADAAKNAFCQIARECYDRTCRVESSEHMASKYAGGPSPLYGSRPIMLAHDETIAEHPESVAQDAATRVSEIMVESLRFVCPDLAPAVGASPTLMKRLFKGAEPVWVDGKLVPWEPKVKA